MKKIIMSILVFLMMLPLSVSTVKAETVYEVGTKEEFTAAVAAINAADSGEFVISLTADIGSAENYFGGATFKKNTTTILGNGFAILLGSNDQTLFVTDEAVLNLGNGNDYLTITAAKRNDSGGAVYVTSGGLVNMYEGTIIKEVVSSNYFGGGVTVYDGGTFHMYGGLITDCGILGGSNCFGGGVGVYHNSRFFMDGGIISNCFAATNYYEQYEWQVSNCAGGGVFVLKGSSFVMNGGTIDNCYAGGISSELIDYLISKGIISSYSGVTDIVNKSAFGGGIAVPISLDAYWDNGGQGFLDSSFVINGGTVSNCYSDIAGGGIAVGGAYLSPPQMGHYSPTVDPSTYGVKITDTKITGNVADSGGGIFLHQIRKPVEFTDTEISLNEAGEGGGVMIYGRYTSAVFTGCDITDNYSDTLGGGAFLYNNGPSTQSAGTVFNNCTIANNIAYDEGSDASVIQSKATLTAASDMNADYTGEPAEHKDLPVSKWYEDYYTDTTTGDKRFVEQTCDEHVEITEMTVNEDAYFAGIVSSVKSDKVNVTFDLNYETDNRTATVQIEKGTKVERPENPSRNGYTFKGWYKDAQTTEEFDFTASINEDVTVYAKWEESTNPSPSPTPAPDRKPVVNTSVK